MKSKLALVLMAAVGSTALVASAQTPYRTDDAPPPNPPRNLSFSPELPQPPIQQPPPPPPRPKCRFCRRKAVAKGLCNKCYQRLRYQRRKATARLGW